MTNSKHNSTRLVLVQRNLLDPVHTCPVRVVRSFTQNFSLKHEGAVATTFLFLERDYELLA